MIRRGVISPDLSADGRRRVLLFDGSYELIAPEMSDGDIASMFNLDEVVRAPRIDFCGGRAVDGPLVGKTFYGINRIGYRVESSVPTAHERQRHVYELVTLADRGAPALFRGIESFDAQTTVTPG